MAIETPIIDKNDEGNSMILECDILLQKIKIISDNDEESYVILQNGTKVWWKINQGLHRKDLTDPIIEYVDGTKIYMITNCIPIIKKILKGIIFHCDKNDRWHREDDEPAIIREDGTKMWFNEGKLYRKNDKPVIVCKDGTKKWYKNGKLNRDNGLPAIVCKDGTKMWFRDGKLYRNKGLPTIEYFDGTKTWHSNEKLELIIINSKELKVAPKWDIWLKIFSEILRFKVENIFLDDTAVNFFVANTAKIFIIKSNNSYLKE